MAKKTKSKTSSFDYRRGWYEREGKECTCLICPCCKHRHPPRNIEDRKNTFYVLQRCPVHGSY